MLTGSQGVPQAVVHRHCMVQSIGCPSKLSIVVITFELTHSFSILFDYLHNIGVTLSPSCLSQFTSATMAKAKSTAKSNGVVKGNKTTRSHKEAPAPVKALPVTLLSGFLVKDFLFSHRYRLADSRNREVGRQLYYSTSFVASMVSVSLSSSMTSESKSSQP